MFKMIRKEKKIDFKKINDFSLYKGYYCVISREGTTLGLFSHYLTYLSSIAKCINEGLIPIVDMQNVDNVWNYGKERTINPWEYYFKQPMDVGLDNLDLSKVMYFNIMVSDLPYLNGPCDSMEFLTNRIAVDYWRGFIKKYIKFSSLANKYLNEIVNENIGCKRTLGVLCRGTDYNELEPCEHPIQPTAEEIISKVREVVEIYGYEKIYLASEDWNICQKFKDVFGDKLKISHGIKLRNSNNDFLNRTYMERDVDIYNNSLEYLSAMYTLSKCNALIAGRTSGSVAAYLMSEGYEYTYFYNLGRYKINNYMP